MSTREHNQLISGLVEELWNQHNAAAIDRYFSPGLREKVAHHYHQLLGGFPSLQVRIEGDPIAEDDMVVARLTLTGTHTGPFAGQLGGRPAIR
jgi:predicted ester cyclase